jgi:hypothetical protein
MVMTAWLEARFALAGLFRLLRGDRGGLGCFDRSLEGFWRSFRAAFLSYPLYLALLMMRVAAADWQSAGALRIVTVETIGYIISWTAFPLVMLSVTRWIGRSSRFFDFMVPYNWYQLPQSALFVLVGLVSANAADSAAVQVLAIGAAAAVLAFEWYLARVALDTTRSAAALVVLVDLVLGALIDAASGSLY